uniref:Uncharacterized protein n=1 Tax=Chlamydomonas leiostraca TaxID=1034604 RepID=A0A7S0WIN3_9CHLO
MQQARTLACKLARAPQPNLSKPRLMGPVLPVTVNGMEARDRERAHLLYKLGDPNWQDPKIISNRVAWTLGLQEKDEKVVEEEIAKLIKVFGRHTPTSGPRTDKRICLPIYLRRGDRVLRDLVHFDVSPPQRSSLVQTAQQYAVSVCRELGLDMHTWYTPLVMQVASVLAEATQDLQLNPGEVQLLPPIIKSDLLQPPQGPGQYPRVEPVDPELDAAEAERNRRREDKLHKRGQRTEGAPAAQGGDEQSMAHSAFSQTSHTTQHAPINL